MRLVTLSFLLTFGCSSSEVVAEVPEEETSFIIDEDSLPSETFFMDDTSTPLDTSVMDTTSGDTGPTDTAMPDTKPVDMGPVDVGTTFPCGSMMCGSSLQFCRRATGPGTCPMDSGVCPAGCPGCAPLPLTCETMPMKCWAKPSCACILVELCGGASKGDCTEKDGAFTAGCRGA